MVKTIFSITFEVGVSGTKFKKRLTFIKHEDFFWPRTPMNLGFRNCPIKWKLNSLNMVTTNLLSEPVLLNFVAEAFVLEVEYVNLIQTLPCLPQFNCCLVTKIRKFQIKCKKAIYVLLLCVQRPTDI